MGLTTWKGGVVRRGDVTVAKNYLNEAEISELNRIVTRDEIAKNDSRLGPSAHALGQQNGHEIGGFAASRKIQAEEEGRQRMTAATHTKPRRRGATEHGHS